MEFFLFNKMAKSKAKKGAGGKPELTGSAKKAQEKQNKKQAQNAEIRELEERISKTKYNKKTQHAIGMYKAKLAALKAKQEARASSKTGKSDHGWTVRKSGDANVVLLGFPSVGKSSLLNVLTNKDSEVGAYAFTTLTCIPGDLKHRGAKIQILDVPGIVKGAAAGTGRGKEVLQVIRNADLVLILLDVFYPEHLEVLKKEVFDTHVRMNQKRPDVKITKTIRGGVRLGATVPLPELDEKTIAGILKQFKLANADVLIRTPINADQFIDVVYGNRSYVPMIKVLNKIDMVDDAHLEEVKSKVKPDLCISVHEKTNLEALKDLIYDSLEFMPVACKEVGKRADTEEPLILRQGNTVEDMCNKLHKDFAKKFKFARVWGPSAKFEGQKLGLQHVLQSGDTVEIHIR